MQSKTEIIYEVAPLLKSLALRIFSPRLVLKASTLDALHKGVFKHFLPFKLNCNNFLFATLSTNVSKCYTRIKVEQEIDYYPRAERHGTKEHYLFIRKP